MHINEAKVLFDFKNSSFSPNVFHVGSTWFVQFNDYHVYFRISGCMIKKTVTCCVYINTANALKRLHN